jgi:mono/diheme cytochrome c family protein
MKRMNDRCIVVGLAVCATLCLALPGGCVTEDNGVVAQSESERVGWKGGQGDSQDARAVAEGRRIAQSKCAACHSIDQSSVSPDAGAPPFRDFVFLNDPDWVAYRLIDGMRLGHDNMPLFDFDVGSADALMAYIGTLND